MTSTEVWLYGSTARGDSDSQSDVDVLVVGDEEFDGGSLLLEQSGRISQARYSWEEVEHMAGYGSLFLHHIKREGYPLVESKERRLRSLLDQLGKYARAEYELDSFRRVLDDVDKSLKRDPSVAFELSVIATAARHAAILGCYLVGEPRFGRESAFQTLLPKLGYDETFVNQVIDLYSFRRAEDESCPPDSSPSIQKAQQWLQRIRELITKVEAMLE
jgi:hypothetical protein